ncbi:sialidase family protein [Streptomyces sp. B6B3]|uniref:sialidase family protein n=1 Tax=Streptomyces sp. B6B3 TaxID=3153570 RepID=UPI00325F0954
MAALLAVLPAPAAATPATPAAAAAPEPAELDEQVLFRAAEEEGYACFRIPAVVETTTPGTLLAFAEGRRDNCGDAGDIDIVVKRSVDGGATWGPLRVVLAGDGDTRGNPAPLVDAETGRILLASTHNAGRADAGNCEVPCERVPYLQYSDDDGETWSEPRSLDAELRPDSWNSWYATSPVHGIQLTHGPHAGRLVFSVNGGSWADGRVTAHHAGLAYSDDGGDTWQLGAVDSWEVGADQTVRQIPQETTLAEREDGSIYVNARDNAGTDLGHRTAAVSSDGGESFDAPFTALPDLYTPVVQGSLLPLRTESQDGYDRWLFAAPADPDRRRTMMIRSSWDEGATWDGVDRGMVVSTDWSGYSDMVALGDNAVGLMYEGGAVDARDEIRFTRFTEEDLGPRRGPDPTTPDGAPSANPAAVLGGPVGTAGAYDGALTFDGTNDAVRLPYRETLPLGESDFTVSLWFRYDADTGTQPFLWMGGVGGAAPQVWVRGEPDSGRLRGLMTAVDGANPAASASVSTREAYNDGAWHHLALTRADGTFTLTVDGAETVSTADVPGTVSRNSVFGVHLGQGVDSRTHLSGALDEVHVFERVLSAEELTALRTANTLPAATPALSLALDETTAPAGEAG